MSRPMIDRFTEKFEGAGPHRCWNWKAAKNIKGYGHFVSGRQTSAHRTAWELYRYNIPKGMHVLHKCDNPACVNPLHLYIGTNQDNVDDKMERGRHVKTYQRGETNGMSKLTQSSVNDIRRIYAGGGITQQRIADIYGMSFQQISRIIRHERWS